MKNPILKIMTSTKYFAAIITLLSLLMLGGNSWGQTPIVTTFNASSPSFTWTCPTGVTSIQVEAWSGGGGGGGASSNTRIYVGGGGAGGNYAKQTAVTVIPGRTYNVNIGAGGIAGANTTAFGYGGIGGTTSFVDQTVALTLISVSGGTGGQLGTAAYTNGWGGTNAGGNLSAIVITAGAYTVAPTIVIGKQWVSGDTYVLNEQVFSGANLYTVTSISSGAGAGTIAPTATSTSVNNGNGTAVLTYAGIAATASTNAGFGYVKFITVGSGYTTAPTVNITGGTFTVQGAATAYINPFVTTNVNGTGTFTTYKGGSGTAGFYVASTAGNSSGTGGGAAESSGNGGNGTLPSAASTSYSGGTGGTGAGNGASNVIATTASGTFNGVTATGVGGGGSGAAYAGVGGAGAPGQLTITYTPPATPTITLSTASITGFSAKTTEVSASKTFTVAGTFLTNDITLTANSDFELSTNGTSFSSSVLLSKSGANVALTTIYVRMKSGVGAGIYSSATAVTASSTGATNGTITCSGSVTTSYFYAGTGSLATASNWGTNADGTGTQPSNFSNSYQLFVIKNTAAVSTDAQWTVSGTESKIIVGDPSSAGVTLTVDSIAGTYYGVNGTIDLAAASTGANKLITKILLQSTAPWTASATYSLNQLVYYGGNVYAATTLGTSGTVAPTHTTGAVAATGGTAALTYSGPYTGTITFGTMDANSEVHFQAKTNTPSSASFGKVFVETSLPGDQVNLSQQPSIQTSLTVSALGILNGLSTSYIYFKTGATATIYGSITTAKPAGFISFSKAPAVDATTNTGTLLQFYDADNPGVNFILGPASTIYLNRGGSNTRQYINARTDYANLTISGLDNVKTINSPTTVKGTLTIVSTGNSQVTLGGAITVKGTLNLSDTLIASSNLTLDNGASIILNNTDTTAGKFDVFPTFGSSVNISYLGTKPMALNYSLPAVVNNLTIANTGGVSLLGDNTINGTLTLTSGKLTLPANGILRIASGNAIVGGSSSSYIVADPSSVVRMDAIASARVLPIGSATNYLPVTITPASTESLNIKVFEGITADGTSAGTALSAPQKTTVVNAVWNISQVGAAAATNSTVKVEWPASLEGADITAAAAADLGLISNSGTGGWNSPTGSLDKTNHSATATVTSFGSFSAGRAAMLFAQPAAKTYGDADFSAGVTSLNASAITYSSNTLSVATIATDGTIHIVGAGTATITASQVVSSDGVYAAVSISRILTVNKKSLTITADNKAKYVGQVNPALTVTYSNDFIAGESATNLTTAPSLSTTAITNSVAGAYPITVSGATSDNYSFVYVNGTLTVNPKLTQTISFTVPSTKVYGDADISVAASSNNNTIAITYTSSNLLVATIAADGTLHIVGAGNTTITASQAGDATYEAASNAKSLTVNKATLTITGVNKTKFINQSNPALTVTYAGFVLGESETILLTPVVAATTALTNSDPGNYPITVNGATAANYDIVFVNGILTIMTAPFEFSAMIARNYGDADFDGGATSINTAQPIVYVSSNLSVATIVNGKIHIVGAGTTDITASQLTDGYYPAGNITRQLVVNKAPSAIVYGALATKTYGNADYIAAATSANSAQTITYASSNPAVATISSTGNIHIVGAGVTDITVSQPGNSNYLAESVTRQLSVSKAVLTITADDKAKYEGQANPALTATYTGFVLGEAASVLLTPAVITTTAVTASLPGTYPITVSGATASNYAISFVSGSLLVNAKLSQTITFAAPTAKVYGNADFSVSASRTNATISLEYTSSNASVATISSTGTIHIVGAGTADLTVMQQANSIYNAASVTRTLTVNKAPLTIAADNKTKYEGQVNPALTLVYEGFVLSESASVLLTPVQITTTAVTASVPATYPITMTGATAANYNITYVSGSLVVQPKLVQTITFAAPATKTYGNADFATGGSSTNASIAVVYSSSNTAVATIVGTNVHIVGAGTADITASQAGSDVYAAATSVVRTLTVNKAALKITADNKSKITEQANPVLTVTYAGFVLNETSAVLQTPTVTSTTAVTASLPGVYPITPSAATAANYLISFVAGNLTVNPKNVQTITFAAPAVKSYGNADFAAGATSTNASIPILYTSSNQQVATIIGNMIHITGAGSAIITATQAGDSFYYAALSMAKTLTVNRVPLTVKANDTTKIQGEDNPVFALSYTGLVAGETGANLLATVSTSAIKGSAAGYYTLSATGADTSNYIITYVSGRLTIYPPGGMDQVNLNAFQSSSSQLTLRIFSLQPTAGDAILYNLNGTPIKKMACDIPRGFSNTKMDLPFLLPGLYIITVKGRAVDCKKVISIL